MIIREQRTIIQNRINLVYRAFELKQTEINSTSLSGNNRQSSFDLLSVSLTDYSDGVNQRITQPHAEFITFMNEVNVACHDFEDELKAA